MHFRYVHNKYSIVRIIRLRYLDSDEIRKLATEQPSLAYAGKSITANYAPTSYGPNLQITQLSVKKAESIQAVWTSFDVIVDVLRKITDGNEADRQTQTQALGLRKRMLSFDFIVAIMHVHEEHCV